MHVIGGVGRGWGLFFYWLAPFLLHPLSPAARGRGIAVRGRWLVWEFYLYYGAYMDIPKSSQARQRAIQVLTIVQVNRACSGATIKQKMAGKMDPWPLSILIGKVVKNGILKVTGNGSNTGPGKTWVRLYALTPAGTEFLARLKEEVAKEPDDGQVTEELIAKAYARVGKWVFCPEGITPSQVKIFKQAGMKVRTVIQWEAEDN